MTGLTSLQRHRIYFLCDRKKLDSNQGPRLPMFVAWLLGYKQKYEHPHIGGFAKRAHPARARYLNVNLARRNRDLQPGGKEIEGGGRGGGGGEGGEK